MEIYRKDGFRIHLRPLEESDIDERYVSWFEQRDAHLDYYASSGRKFTADVLISDLRNAAANHNYFYAIVDNASGAVIGNIRIGPINVRHKTSDLATLIGDRSFVGKGLAREAVALGNEIAFEKHDVRKLYSGMFEENVASVKAYVAAGWVIEGRLKGQFLVGDRPSDRILVACFNPKYFPNEVTTSQPS